MSASVPFWSQLILRCCRSVYIDNHWQHLRSQARLCDLQRGHWSSKLLPFGHSGGALTGSLSRGVPRDKLLLRCKMPFQKSGQCRHVLHFIFASRRASPWFPPGPGSSTRYRVGTRQCGAQSAVKRLQMRRAVQVQKAHLTWRTRFFHLLALSKQGSVGSWHELLQRILFWYLLAFGASLRLLLALEFASTSVSDFQPGRARQPDAHGGYASRPLCGLSGCYNIDITVVTNADQTSCSFPLRRPWP